MPIRLRATADPVAVARLLADLSHQAKYLATLDQRDSLEPYARWSTNTLRKLGHVLSSNEAERLIATPRYWMLQSVVNETMPVAQVHNMISLELEQRSRALLDARAELLNGIWSWRDGKAVAAILDTNILIHEQHYLFDVNWNRKLSVFYDVPVILAIPMKVVDELDGLKDRGVEKVRAKARTAIKMIEDTIRWDIGSAVVLEQRMEPGLRMNSEVHLLIMKDEPDHLPLPVADAEIVDRALAISPMVTSTWIVSNDTGIRFRPASVGLQSANLSYEDVHL
jgi:hypothetical protein